MGNGNTAIDELLISALPARPAHVVCIGTELTSLERDIRRVAGEDAVIQALPIEGLLTCQLSIPDDSQHAIVLHETLYLLDEDQLSLLLDECYRALVDGGRIIVRERTIPFDGVALALRKLFQRMGMAYTPTEVFTFLERAGFWECLVLRRRAFDSSVVIRGEKVEQKAVLDHVDSLDDGSPVITVVR